MWFSVAARALLGASMATAMALPAAGNTAPKDPGHTMKLFTLEQMKEAPVSFKEPSKADEDGVKKMFKVNAVNANAGCAANPNMRFEWREYSDSDRHALVDSIQCLRSRPARIGGSNNRFEDFAVIHRDLSPSIHNNQKFLLWHRYFLWAFEQDAGHFSQLDMFSPTFFGTMHGCLNDGKFAGLQQIGGGCVSREGTAENTAQCNSDFENYCRGMGNYPDFERCWEYGPHGYGHNGIGGTMAYVEISPSDPAFYMHHSYVDRVYRVWQNADVSRRTSISGLIADGSPLTMDTPISIGGIRPDVRVRDVIDTLDGAMCYRYTY
ncbi:Di-copper centre-containing protein [Apiospora kogelbergensis]|uniref:Di-copper centre-containing protein n=1 Tax=Apiospora kogelbergensis TaxID=1337665 RepID=UPI0031303EB9